MIRINRIQMVFLFAVWVFLILNGCGDQNSIDSANAPKLLTPETLIFPETPVDSSRRKTFVLKNAGEGILEIDDIKIVEDDGDGIAEMKKGDRWTSRFSLEPGQQKRLTIIFAPQNTAHIQGELVVSSNSINADENGQNQIQFKTPELAPAIASNTIVRFSTVSPGEMESRNLTVQNVGSAFLKFDEIFLKDSTSEEFELNFLEDSGSTNPPVQRLAARSSFEIEIQFSPSDTSLSKNQLVFVTNDPNRSQYTVELRGNSHFPCLTTSARDGIGFGEEEIGQNTTKTKTVTNCSSDRDLEINNISLTSESNPQFELTNTPRGLPDKVLGPGEQIPFSIEFAPNAERAFDGKGKIKSAHPTRGEISIPLSGQGIDQSGPIDCGDGQVEWVDNIPDVRPHQHEHNCKIFVFPEKKDFSPNGFVSTNGTSFNDDTSGGNVSQPINSYYIHYDRRGDTQRRERSQGTVEFDNRIVGIIHDKDALAQSHSRLGICQTNGFGSCHSNSTIYPGTASSEAFALEDHDMRSAKIGPKTLDLDLFTNSSSDNLRVLTKSPTPNDNTQDCEDNNVVRVENVSDMRPNQTEDDCKIKIFPEKRNVSHSPLDVEVTRLTEGGDGSNPVRIDTSQQPVNVYGVHYDDVDGRPELSEGVATFDNEIIGVILRGDALRKSNQQLGICQSNPGHRRSCSSPNTVYPLGTGENNPFDFDSRDIEQTEIVDDHRIRLDVRTVANTDNARIITKAN